MTFRGSNVRSIGLGGLLAAFALMAIASSANAEGAPFLFSGEPIHPACVHALVMKKGERIPVTSSVSLAGCMVSPRSKGKTTFQDRTISFSDDAVLGGGTFSYRVLSVLDNGLEILGIRRVFPDGTEKVSIAAVDVVARPAVFDGEVVTRLQLEMIGEVWIKDLQLASLRTAGNKVHYQAGIGATRVDRTMDLSSIGRARNRKK
jgi:hypothetical protein